MLIISLVGFSIKDQDRRSGPRPGGRAGNPGGAGRDRGNSLGLNDPFLIQYFRFVKNAVTEGDLGRSFCTTNPTWKSFFPRRRPPSNWFRCRPDYHLVSCPWGSIAPCYPKHPLPLHHEFFHPGGLHAGVSDRHHADLYLFRELGWLPSYGGRDRRHLRPGLVGQRAAHRDGLLHLILPCVSLSSIMLPLFIRLIRSEMMEVLETEYIKFAWAKGLSPTRVWMCMPLKTPCCR
jgi:peptide/nickel transport system permease protein